MVHADAAILLNKDERQPDLSSQIQTEAMLLDDISSSSSALNELTDGEEFT